MLDTGFRDENGEKIYHNDTLENKYGYTVIVKLNEDGEFYGKLVCDESHPCRNIPYALNSGSGYRKINNNEKTSNS